MKKRKYREALNGHPMEWPKNMPAEMVNKVQRLSGDTVVFLVCEWVIPLSNTTKKDISATRRQAQEKECSVTSLGHMTYLIKASLRFIQCLLAQCDVRPLKIQDFVNYA